MTHFFDSLNINTKINNVIKNRLRRTRYTTKIVLENSIKECFINYLTSDVAVPLEGLYRGYAGGTSSSITDNFTEYGGRYIQRTHKGYIGQLSLFSIIDIPDSFDVTYNPHVIAVIRPENLVHVKYNYLIHGKIDLKYVTILIDKDLDSPEFYSPNFRAFYRKNILPQIESLKVKVIKCPLDFIRKSCFLQPFELKSKNIIKRKQEINELVDRFLNKDEDKESVDILDGDDVFNGEIIEQRIGEINDTLDVPGVNASRFTVGIPDSSVPLETQWGRIVIPPPPSRYLSQDDVPPIEQLRPYVPSENVTTDGTGHWRYTVRPQYPLTPSEAFAIDPITENREHVLHMDREGAALFQQALESDIRRHLGEDVTVNTEAIPQYYQCSYISTSLIEDALINVFYSPTSTSNTESPTSLDANQEHLISNLEQLIESEVNV